MSVESFFRFLLGTLILMAVALGATLLWLIYPGIPRSSHSLAFDGFIVFPQKGIYTIFDYLSVAGDHLFVAAMTAGDIFDVSLSPVTHQPQDRIRDFPGEPAVHGVAIVPGLHLAFISRSQRNTVDVIDLDSWKSIASIPVPDDPDAILYDPASNLIYVASGAAGSATLINPDNKSVVATIPLPGRPEFAVVDPRSGLVYQNLESANAVVAIDLPHRKLLGRWSLNGCVQPSGLDIDPASRRLFAVCMGNSRLVVFNLESHRVIANLAIGAFPDSVVFDSSLRRIYTASGVGWLTVIQEDGRNAYRVLDTIRTHFGAHTLAVDPASHKVFVAYASLFANPRLAVFSPVGPIEGDRTEGRQDCSPRDAAGAF